MVYVSAFVGNRSGLRVDTLIGLLRSMGHIVVSSPYERDDEEARARIAQADLFVHADCDVGSTRLAQEASWAEMYCRMQGRPHLAYWDHPERPLPANGNFFDLWAGKATMLFGDAEQAAIQMHDILRRMPGDQRQ